MAAAGRWTVLALAVLSPALAPAAEPEPVLCGTRWLAEQRASGVLPPLPAARPAASRQAEPPPVAVGTEQLFPVYGSVTPVRATCRYAGPRCFVFVENAQWDTEGGPVLQSDVDKLAELFEASTPADPDRGIYDLIVEAFGEAEDVDGYEQIFLLVLDLADPHLVGFFDPAGFTADGSVENFKRRRQTEPPARHALRRLGPRHRAPRARAFLHPDGRALHARESLRPSGREVRPRRAAPPPCGCGSPPGSGRARAARVRPRSPPAAPRWPHARLR